MDGDATTRPLPMVAIPTTQGGPSGTSPLAHDRAELAESQERLSGLLDGVAAAGREDGGFAAAIVNAPCHPTTTAGAKDPEVDGAPRLTPFLETVEGPETLSVAEVLTGVGGRQQFPATDAEPLLLVLGVGEGPKAVEVGDQRLDAGRKGRIVRFGRHDPFVGTLVRTATRRRRPLG